MHATPLSVSAVSGEALRRGDIQDISQLHGIPGLSFVDGGTSYTRIVIRGIQTVGEPTVGLYYDETPVTGLVSSSGDAGGSMPEIKLFDVNHVEVLRDPQGTLYGSGAMGGAENPLQQAGADRFGHDRRLGQRDRAWRQRPCRAGHGQSADHP